MFQALWSVDEKAEKAECRSAITLLKTKAQHQNQRRTRENVLCSFNLSLTSSVCRLQFFTTAFERRTFSVIAT